MAKMDHRLAAKTVLSALIIAAAGLSFPPLAGADDPEPSGGQGQDACADGGQGQPQDPQACGSGIANQIIGEGQNAANQAARAAGQNPQNGPTGDRPPQDLITSTRCVIFNGVPTLWENTWTRMASPLDSPMEGKPCWYAFGVSPTHS